MNLNFVGASCVKLAFFMALVGIVFSCWGAIAKREDLVRAGQRAVVSVWGLLLIAVFVLLRALVTRDYSLEYVVEEVDAAMPMHYRLAALWGGMNGSLLWWSLICAT